MAFSLEAALVVPLSIVVWVSLLVLNEPAYQRVEQSGSWLVEATGYSLENQHLYQTRQSAMPDGNMTALQVSPQSVLEICSLIQDDGRLIGRLLGGSANGGETQSVDRLATTGDSLEISGDMR